jgi:protein-S-isoprenylcysteine O-methyltransferase Ste14
MIEWLNFFLLFISTILFSYFYTLSIQPIKRVEKRGERAWNECMKFRILSIGFEIIKTINLVLWTWFPIPILNWKIHSNYLIGFIIGFVIGLPCAFILLKGVKDAGSETIQPSKETLMYPGIYKYIRHPQSTGEFPLFIALAFSINSWFLVIVMAAHMIIYLPIMIYFEEKDLIRRFGDSYRDYQKRTGAIFPKIRKK